MFMFDLKNPRISDVFDVLTSKTVLYDPLLKYSAIDNFVDESITAPHKIYETDDSIFIEIELPGVSKENIEINLNNSELVVKAKRKIFYNKEDSKETKIKNKYIIKSQIDNDAVDAKLENGILVIKLRKQQQTKNIEVK